MRIRQRETSVEEHARTLRMVQLQEAKFAGERVQRREHTASRQYVQALGTRASFDDILSVGLSPSDVYPDPALMDEHSSY